MAKEENLQIQKSCILLSNDQVSVRQWRKYIADNWRELTFCLHDGCIVILFGRHGEEGGQIGDEDPAIQRWHEEQFEMLEKDPEVQQDMEKNNIEIKLVNVCKYFDKKKLNLEDLMHRLREINPLILVISICHSVNLDLRFALEVEGLFARMRLQRDLNLTTNGKQITLDPTQKELLKQLAKDENNPKTVVISGHEGSGKSLLAVEATKMKICSFVKQHPGENRKKIRVVLCAAYQGENRVPVLFQFLKEELKYFQRFCYLETKPLADVSFNSVEDLQSRIQKELAIDPPVYTRKDDISFTKLLPKVKEEKTMSEAPTVQNQQASNLNQAQKMASNSKIKKTEDTSLSQQNIDQNIQVNKDSEAETEVQEDKNHTIVLLDELLPKFDLHQWKHLKSDSNVEYVVAIRHTFSQSSFPKVQRLKEVSILDDSNTLVCVLDKKLRD